jgi:hypothetical protein
LRRKWRLRVTNDEAWNRFQICTIGRSLWLIDDFSCNANEVVCDSIALLCSAHGNISKQSGRGLDGHFGFAIGGGRQG